ncbi:odorant receptor Or2-like [Trichogramma pretiosum]|uniref:odorant receptor Or2-like n=1 Tax=Trichogramma pretiosum TaxID=7493 RepID=UPI0006C9D5AC|nr:odorant receptor Or2-like [Trichogramma pretiosum]
MEEKSSFYRGVRRVQSRVLRLAGLIPLENGKLGFVGTVCLSVYVNLAFSAVSSVYVWAFVEDCRNRRFNPDITSEMFSFVGFHLRFLYIFGRRRKLAAMLDYCESLWTRVESHEKVHVRGFVRKVSKLSCCYSGIILTTITLYVLSSQLPQLTATSSNETVHRVLPYPFYFDVQSSPRYEILLATQIACLLTVTQTSVCVDTSIAFLIMIACGHFRLIQVRLEQISSHIDANEREAHRSPLRIEKTGPLSKILDNKDDDRVERETRVDGKWTGRVISRKIRQCVKYHGEILQFCTEIARLSSEIFMIELISTTYNLSLIGILLAGNMPLTEKFKFAPVLLILTTQLFVCQYPPDLLLRESLGVSDSVYFVPPFRNDRWRIDRMLLMMLRRSQRPYQLLAGGQIKLNIESFGNMIRGAVSFFTVLRSFN